MANYQSSHIGSQVDSAVAAALAAISSGGIVNNNQLASYSTTTQMNSAINAKFPVGAVYITATNSNPASYLGGTWTLIDKSLRYVYVNSYAPTRNTSNCTDVAVFGWYEDHGIFLSVDFTPKVAITDTALEMCTINPNTFGLSAFPDTNRVTYLSDGGNAIISATINTAGVVTTNDVIVRGSSTASLAAATNLTAFTTYFNVRHNLMLDAECNKFYWQRTA